MVTCSSPSYPHPPLQEAVWKPEAYVAEAETSKDADWLATKDADELEELEDDFADDRVLQEIRWGGCAAWP
jgi:hypothetical protein